VSYRNLLVYRGKEDFELKTRPPHEVPEEPVVNNLPQGRGSEILRKIMDESADLFADHEVNRARLAAGKNVATQVWLWGQGHAPSMPTFEKKFGIKSGCMITGVDLLRGLANLLGWHVQEVAGMTSFHDTNYVGQGHDTAAMLDKYDLVLSHIEAPDEASHQADVKTKIAAIEHIDQLVVGPVLEKLRTFSDWRLLVMPDHPTNIATRKHGYSPTLFAIAGSNVKSMGANGYSEKAAKAGKLSIERGHELMEYFLRG
jgi:2,3-bisphosphoglycerate-independent phosphoglycerate mutase